MTTCTCPTCGVTLHISADEPKKRKRRSIFESSVTQHFDQSVAPAYQQRHAAPVQAVHMEPGTRREVEQRRPETPIDVITFALKSLGYGVAVSMISVPFTIWIDKLAWYTPLMLVLPAAGLAWFGVSGRAQGLLTLTEKITKLDLNGDGKIGTLKQERTVEVIVKTDEIKRHDQRATMPDTSNMHNLAMEVLDDGVFNESTAKSCGFSRAKWIELRDLFLDRGWVVWKDARNHNAGLNVMAAGRVALRGCLPRPDGTSD